MKYLVHSVSNPKDYFKVCGYVAILVIVTLFLLHFIPYECPFLKYFHIWCSGCGGTRMIHSILHFQFYQAFRYNALLFILLMIGIIYSVVVFIIYQKKKVLYVPSYYTLLFILFLVILFMILRNIPYFSYLIPTEV